MNHFRMALEQEVESALRAYAIRELRFERFSWGAPLDWWPIEAEIAQRIAEIECRAPMPEDDE